LSQLQSMDWSDLKSIAKRKGMQNADGCDKQRLIDYIIRENNAYQNNTIKFTQNNQNYQKNINIDYSKIYSLQEMNSMSRADLLKIAESKGFTNGSNWDKQRLISYIIQVNFNKKQKKSDQNGITKRFTLSELNSMTWTDLKNQANRMGLRNAEGLPKQRLIDYIVQSNSRPQLTIIYEEPAKPAIPKKPVAPNCKRILVVANVSAGKSTLINALVGYRINRTKTTVCTNKLLTLRNKVNAEDGIFIEDKSGTRTNIADVEAVDSNDFVYGTFMFNSSLKGDTCLIDTPGINNSEDLTHKEITENAIREDDYEAIIYVSNCQYFGTNDERYILTYLHRQVNKPIIFVLNQLDRFKQQNDSISKMMADYKSDLIQIGFANPIVIPVSSLAALMFKLPTTRLDEEDEYDRSQMEKKFSREYYDLPTYIGKGSHSYLLETTGIVALEEAINNIA